jgi:hypothetical protein
MNTLVLVPVQVVVVPDPYRFCLLASTNTPSTARACLCGEHKVKSIDASLSNRHRMKYVAPKMKLIHGLLL